jgi:hypothetical protein
MHDASGNTVALAGVGAVVTEGRTFQREFITDLWAELAPLAAEHLAETGISAGLPLKLDKDAYAEAQSAGRHFFHTVRLNGELIGYCSTIICRALRDSQLEAHEDGIYVVPRHRGYIGSELENWVDDIMWMDHGCVRSYRERIVTTDQGDRASRRGPVGYKAMSVLWVKQIRPQVEVVV